MDELILLIRKQVRMIWRYRWIALISAMVISISGWFTVLTLPDQYEVTAKVYMDTSSLLRPLLRGLAVDNRMRHDRARMVRRTLLSRPNMETVARNADLDLESKTPEEFERVLQGLERRIQVSETGRDNIFNIRYQHSEPKVATRVVETLLSLFVERSLGETRKDTNQTRQFIDRQIAEYETKLKQAETKLKEFKQENLGLMPAQGGDYYARLENSQMTLAEARLQLEEAVKRRDALKSQLRGEDLSDEELAASGLVTSQYQQRIDNLEERLDEFSLTYTEEHPDVVATRRVLEDLKMKRAEEFDLARAALAQGRGVMRGDSIYREGQVVLGQADAQVAALKARVQEYERREKELQSLVDKVLDVEAQFAQVNRDYDIYKARYRELVERRESLQMSEEADQATDEIQFNVVEPPREPLLPIGPDREKLNLAVLVLGLGGGVGLGWLGAMLRPSLYSKDDFSEFTDLPVLGSISRLWTPAVRVGRQMEVTSFGITFSLLLAMFLVISGTVPLGIDLSATLKELGLNRFDLGDFGLERLRQLLL